MQFDSEVNDGLGDLRTNSADNTVGAHQPRGGNCLEKMLRNLRVHGRHAGNVEDRDAGFGSDDALEQVLHHYLRAGAVERANQRERENSLEKPYDRRRKLEHLLLLPLDHVFAGLLKYLDRIEAQLVDEQRGG